MKPSARMSPALAWALLPTLAASGVVLAQDASQAAGSAIFRIGITLVRSCELRTDPAAAITCTRPVPYRLGRQPQAALPQLDALTPPSPQRPPQADAGTEARFDTFTF